MCVRVRLCYGAVCVRMEEWNFLRLEIQVDLCFFLFDDLPQNLGKPFLVNAKFFRNDFFLVDFRFYLIEIFQFVNCFFVFSFHIILFFIM